MAAQFLGADPHDQHSLRARVFNHIREDILDGRYKPGDSLVETKLAEELGVSRTPIREAIRQLELEGLVLSIPNKGVIVQGISTQDINDIYTIRKLIEGLAARWAVDRITAQELKNLQEIQELMDYYTKKKDFEQVAILDTKFHDTIYEASKSKILRIMLSSFHHYVRRARLNSLQVPGRARDALLEHENIVDAFIKRDGELAEKLLTRHVSNACSNLLSHKEQV
ncbi:MAG: GntR family transcriptional regulator [Mahellales bacterium]